MNDYDFLSQEGNIGFYNKCEVTKIFRVEIDSNDTFDIFTLFVFEDTNQPEVEEYITSSLRKFKNNKKYKWGIKREIITLSEARVQFNKLSQENKPSAKQYVAPNNSLAKVQVNNVLKNNFHSGSYILEFFDKNKKQFKFLLDNPDTLNDFSEEVSRLIPIHIGAISDRLGNCIFQFPINLLYVKLLTIGQDKGISFGLEFNQKLQKIPKLQAIAENKLDGIVLDFVVQDVEDNKPILINTSDEVNCSIFDKEKNILLYRENFATVKQFVLSGNIGSEQDRFFDLNGVQQRVAITHPQPPMIIGESDRRVNDWIRGRKYTEELDVLEKSKAFLQYEGTNNHQAALQDIRQLINQHSANGVYLWDPYLSVLDIKETLYFCDKMVNMKVITADTKITKNEFLIDDLEYLFLNLEVRKYFKVPGSKFHDRFLIFPLEKPKIWSLGTSINSVGKSHHIMQEVSHPQHILDAFNDLWGNLNNEECLVWKST